MNCSISIAYLFTTVFFVVFLVKRKKLLFAKVDARKYFFGLVCLWTVTLLKRRLWHRPENTRLRNSHRRCSIKKGVLRNFTKFTGKHLCQSPFYNKVAGLRPLAKRKKLLFAKVNACDNFFGPASLKPAILLKKRLWHSCFPVNFANF